MSKSFQMIYGVKYYLSRRKPSTRDNLVVFPVITPRDGLLFYVEEGVMKELEYVTKLSIRAVKRQRLRDITLMFYIPPNDLRQGTVIVDKSHVMTIKEDILGNKLVEVSIDVIPPGKRELISVKQKVKLKPFVVGEDIEFPQTEISKTSEGRLQAISEEIIAVARKLRSENSLDTLINCVRFVRGHVRYRRKPYRLGSLFALKSRKGACIEIVDLCASILKSLGIPARTVIGYVIGGSFHAWLEILTIKNYWVPIDPTMGILGIGSRWLKIYTEPKPGTKILRVDAKEKIALKMEIYLEGEKIK